MGDFAFDADTGVVASDSLCVALAEQDGADHEQDRGVDGEHGELAPGREQVRRRRADRDRQGRTPRSKARPPTWAAASPGTGSGPSASVVGAGAAVAAPAV